MKMKSYPKGVRRHIWALLSIQITSQLVFSLLRIALGFRAFNRHFLLESPREYRYFRNAQVLARLGALSLSGASIEWLLQKVAQLVGGRWSVRKFRNKGCMFFLIFAMYLTAQMMICVTIFVFMCYNQDSFEYSSYTLGILVSQQLCVSFLVTFQRPLSDQLPAAVSYYLQESTEEEASPEGILPGDEAEKKPSKDSTSSEDTVAEGALDKHSFQEDFLARYLSWEDIAGNFAHSLVFPLVFTVLGDSDLDEGISSDASSKITIDKTLSSSAFSLIMRMQIVVVCISGYYLAKLYYLVRRRNGFALAVQDGESSSPSAGDCIDSIQSPAQKKTVMEMVEASRVGRFLFSSLLFQEDPSIFEDRSEKEDGGRGGFHRIVICNILLTHFSLYALHERFFPVLMQQEKAPHQIGEGVDLVFGITKLLSIGAIASPILVNLYLAIFNRRPRVPEKSGTSEAENQDAPAPEIEMSAIEKKKMDPQESTTARRRKIGEEISEGETPATRETSKPQTGETPHTATSSFSANRARHVSRSRTKLRSCIAMQIIFSVVFIISLAWYQRLRSFEVWNHVQSQSLEGTQSVATNMTVSIGTNSTEVVEEKPKTIRLRHVEKELRLILKMTQPFMTSRDRRRIRQMAEFVEDLAEFLSGHHDPRDYVDFRAKYGVRDEDLKIYFEVFTSTEGVRNAAVVAIVTSYVLLLLSHSVFGIYFATYTFQVYGTAERGRLIANRIGLCFGASFAGEWLYSFAIGDSPNDVHQVNLGSAIIIFLAMAAGVRAWLWSKTSRSVEAWNETADKKDN